MQDEMKISRLDSILLSLVSRPRNTMIYLRPVLYPHGETILSPLSSTFRGSRIPFPPKDLPRWRAIMVSNVRIDRVEFPIRKKWYSTARFISRLAFRYTWFVYDIEWYTTIGSIMMKNRPILTSCTSRISSLSQNCNILSFL